MPISAPSPRSNTNPNYKNKPSPDAAGLISFFMPGLGQIWGGERRKGALFLAAHVINVAALSSIVFSPWIIKWLEAFGQANEMKVNQQLSQSFTELGFGSPTAVIISLLLLSFAVFAARDAFDHSARKKRQAIYHDFVMAMPEATSGSYIFHVSLLLACLVLAFFFLIPAAPHSQVTDIEFVQNEENTKEKLITNKHAEHNSKAAGKHDPTRPTETASSQQASAKSSKNSAREPKRGSKAEVSKAVSKDLSKLARESRPAEPQKPAEPPRPVEVSKPKADPTATPNFAPRPQPQPVAHVLSASLPKPFALSPLAFAPRPTVPTIVPTITTMPTNVQSPPLPAPAVGKSPSVAPVPVSLNKLAMGIPGPAMPHSPGRVVASGTEGTPTPIAVTSSARGGTDGGGTSPQPVPVKIGHGTGPGSKGTTNTGPTPTRGTKTGTSDGQPGGPLGAVLTPKLASTGPGSGTFKNPEGGPKEGDSSKACIDIDWTAYMADLQRHIKRCWYPPHQMETKRVKVIFTVTTTGEMRNLRLLQSSGLTIADKAALKAAEDAAPFRHLPEHAPVSVDIEFTFDYNVFSGGGMR